MSEELVKPCRGCGQPAVLGHLCKASADDARRHFEEQRRLAESTGQRLNLAGIDYEAVAREMSNEEKLVYVDGKLWSAPDAPKTWLVMDRNPFDGAARYQNPARSLVAMMTCAMQLDGRAWIHFSLSHRKRIPTWGELGVAKEEFLGDREAYQILPPRRRYVNIDARVLNIFALLDPAASALPDFTRGTGAL